MIIIHVCIVSYLDSNLEMEIQNDGAQPGQAVKKPKKGEVHDIINLV